MPDLRGEGVCAVASMPRGCCGVLCAARGEEVGVDIVPGVVSLGEGVEEVCVGDVVQVQIPKDFGQVGWRPELTALGWRLDVRPFFDQLKGMRCAFWSSGSKFLLSPGPIE